VIVRIYYKKLGAHYHCRVFTGTLPDGTFAKSGDLVFRESEWAALQDLWWGVAEFLPETWDLPFGGTFGKPPGPP
jgi:hypothetical protein